MKQLTQVLIAGLMMVVGFSASAGEAPPKNGTCYVLVSGPCIADRNVKGLWFADGEQGSHYNPVRCLQRAAEYYHYCANKAAQFYVTTAFQDFKGVNLVVTYTSINGTYVTGPGAGGRFGQFSIP